MNYYYLDINDTTKIGEAHYIIRFLTSILADEMEDLGPENEATIATMKAIEKLGWILSENRDAIVSINDEDGQYTIHELIIKEEN